MESDDKLPESENISSFSHTWVNGVCMSSKFSEFIDTVNNWEVRDEDVWICSFHKSGTTWTQEMVWLLMNNLDYEKAKLDLDFRSPFFELAGMMDIKISPTEVPLAYSNSFEYVKQISQCGPVCIKTHLPWVLLPKAIQEESKKPKIIYISRNPKEVAVSMYYHRILFFNYRGTLEEDSNTFLNDMILCCPYWPHVLSFWKRRNQPNILFLRYEELKEYLPGVIRRVAAFLDKPLTDSQIETLSDHLSFSKMRNNKAVSKEIFLKFFNPVKTLKGSFIRSGKVDGYKTEMSSDLIETFDRWIKENTVGTDYKV